MKAVEILREKTVAGNLVIEMVVWRLPEPMLGSGHCYKYRLYCGRNGQCLVRYDNERGKGDHVHYGIEELPYSFVDLGQLLNDFQADVARLTGGGI